MALAGLTGLYGPDPVDTTDYMDEGVLEAKANALAEDHGHYGSQSVGYSGTVPDASPFSGMPVYDGFDEEGAMEYGGRDFPGIGKPYDRTPTSHSAPWPRGIRQMSWDNPNGLAEAGEQLTALHSPDFGGPKFLLGRAPAGHEEETHYSRDRYDAPNDNVLSSDVAGQLRGAGSNSVGASGHGNADPTQGYGVLNSTPEFQMGHSIRVVQHDSAHFDYTNTHGEQNVPFLGRHPVYQMPLDGPDSPYFAEGNINGAQIPWEGRIGDPSPYVQSPEPTIGEAPAPNDVFAW